MRSRDWVVFSEGTSGGASGASIGVAYLCVPTKGPTRIVVETVGAGARKSVCFCNLRRWSVGCHQRLRSRWAYFPPLRRVLASVKSRIAFYAETIKSRNGVSFDRAAPSLSSDCTALGLSSRAEKSLAASLVQIPFPQNWDGFTGSKTSERPAGPRVATILVADAEIGVGIVAIPAPLIEDPRQRHIASFKGFSGRLLGLSDRSNEPCE